MKTIKQFGIVLTMVLSTTLFSCSSDSDSNSGGGNAALGQIVAKVAGTNFASMDIATFATKQVVVGMTTIIVQGSNASGKAIQLILSGANVTTGTYEISDTANIEAIASYTDVNINNPMDTSVFAAPYDNSGVVGSITITEITDTNIKGNFTFTGKNQDGGDTKAITDGAFNVNFTSN